MRRETVVMLQGGGALGAYECGVFRALAEHGIVPDPCGRRFDRRGERRDHSGKPGWKIRGGSRGLLERRRCPDPLGREPSLLRWLVEGDIPTEASRRN